MNLTPDLSLSQICSQRKLNLLFYTPPTRLMSINVYEQNPRFTKRDFDIRRKAEILKYPANKSNTKTNNITKRQTYANILSGNYNVKAYPDIILKQKNISNNIITYDTIVVKYPDYYIAEYDPALNLNEYDISSTSIRYTIIPNQRLCKSNDIIKTPTSSSGVPGPIQYLYYDPNVPLYNYQNNQNSYAIINEINNDKKWLTYDLNDIFISNENTETIGYLKILDTYDSDTFTLSFSSPIAILINTDSINTENTNNTVPVHISVKLIIAVSVYLNDNRISTINHANITFDKGLSSTITESFDVSSDKIFSNFMQIGNVDISNTFFQVTPNMIYTIKMTCIIQDNGTDTNYSTYFSNINAGIFCNYTTKSIIRNINIIS